MKILIISSLIVALILSGNLPAYSSQNGEITEVSFERKGCHGFCPIDQVIFRRNSSHSYTGIKYVDRIGDYQADLREYKFDMLVRVLERLNYVDLKEEYGSGTSDAEVITLSVTRGGKTKTITSSDPERMPVELVLIHAFIENIVPKIRWKKVGR